MYTGADPSLASPSRKIYALSKLAESISTQVGKAYSGVYWITAEVIKLSYYPHSGHCYPELAEKRNGAIVAQMRGFIQGARFREINKRFLEVTGQPLGDGMQILFSCKVGYHPLHGLSLNIMDIEPAFTLGEMARLRREAIVKLTAEGILDANRSLRLPMLIRRIAVISVETSKGWSDFNSVLSDSPYRNAIQVQLHPALLQGDAAVSSILGAMESIHRDAERYDAVSIIRGGGGDVGLDCFDHYLLGRAVCNFPLPVLTGIGHATNLTVVEQVAARNLITPTALGRFITEGYAAFAKRIEDGRKALLQTQQRISRLEHVAVESMLQKLSKAAGGLIAGRLHQIEMKHLQLDNTGKTMLTRENEQLRQRWLKLASDAKSIQANKLHQIELLASKVSMLDPARNLQRGYSITLHNGKAVLSASALQAGDILETRFAQGTAISTITDTKHE